jgi:hypothetical protein
MADELTREELYARLNKAEAFIAREGYRTCSAAACNCGSWHGGSWFSRYEEIRDVAIEAGVKTNGVLLVDAIRDALNRRATPEPSEADAIAETALSEIADFAQGEGVFGNLIAEKARVAIDALRAAKGGNNG